MEETYTTQSRGEHVNSTQKGLTQLWGRALDLLPVRQECGENHITLSTDKFYP